MTLEDFQDVYKDKTPLEKLKLLIVQTDYIRDNVRSMERYRINGNEKGADYMRSEIRAMEERIQWLYDQLAPVLKAQEPRVLSYDEARNHAMQVMNPDSIKPLFIEFREKYDDEEEERPPWRGGYNQRLLLARSMDYNVRFRFWTERPTPEQMEATPWD